MDNLSAFLPPLTIIVNQCLSEGMPLSYKHSLVIPRLKKPSLDANSLTNYRPVSNLNFISKIIERIVASRITNFISSHKLFDPQQSAYRFGHSCETAILSLLNDVFLSTDQGEVTVLIMLDLSSAFDTVDHTLLIDQLYHLGFRDGALQWIRSYLANRTQAVKIGNVISSSLPLQHGVPQGSVLGPLLFVLYLTGIEAIIRAHNLKYKVYADDIQLYATTTPAQLVATLVRIGKCVDDIRTHLTEKFLYLNDGKTEATLLGSPMAIKRCGENQINIGGQLIDIKSPVRDLGVILDSTLTMDPHINQIVRKAFMQLRLIGRQRRAMNLETRLAAVQSLVIPHIDYCVSLLTGISKKQMQRVQRVLHAGMRLVYGLRRREPITPLLILRGWLPVSARIQLRTLCLVYAALNNAVPLYINELLQTRPMVRSLRSSQLTQLDIPRSRTKMADRAFAISAARWWNDLPESFKEIENPHRFRESVATYLFEQWKTSAAL
jgi:hypothetical protein